MSKQFCPSLQFFPKAGRPWLNAGNIGQYCWKGWGVRYLVDRIKIEYTEEGAENLRLIHRRLAEPESELYKRLLHELRSGFPIESPNVQVSPLGEREWTIVDPCLDDTADLEIDLAGPDVDVDPLGYVVYGEVEHWFIGEKYPIARFLCAGIRELRRDLRG